MFELKAYQEECLSTLSGYLKRARGLGDAPGVGEASRRSGAATAFYEVTGERYREVEGLEGMPFVCVKVPTGGGKTAIAAHAVRPLMEAWGQRESGPVLWLAPSRPIV